MKETGRAEWKGTLILLLAAFVWGTTFVAQSIGADSVGPFTYLASRTWISVILLFPVERLLSARAARRELERAARKAPGHNTEQSLTLRRTPGMRKTTIFAGAVCGFFLFTASAAQQAGIAYTTAAKSGFITALYVVFVPVIYALVYKGVSPKVWVCMILAVLGLYLLCMKGDLVLGKGDALTLLCAVLYSFQIMCINRYAGEVGGVRLTLLQFVVEAILATVCMLLFESPTAEAVRIAFPSILYAGVLSGCVGYTLQSVGQEWVNPATASIAMSFESVFGALGGWVVLHEALSARELAGCVIMFVAIILAQLPVRMPHFLHKPES